MLLILLKLTQIVIFWEKTFGLEGCQLPTSRIWGAGSQTAVAGVMLVRLVGRSPWTRGALFVTRLGQRRGIRRAEGPVGGDLNGCVWHNLIIKL